MILEHQDTWVSDSQRRTIPIWGSCAQCAIKTTSLRRSSSWLSTFSF